MKTRAESIEGRKLEAYHTAKHFGTALVDALTTAGERNEVAIRLNRVFKWINFSQDRLIGAAVLRTLRDLSYSPVFALCLEEIIQGARAGIRTALAWWRYA